MSQREVWQREVCIIDDELGASNPPADLLYGLEDKPPVVLSLFVALQHVFAVFVGIVTPPVLIARALKLPANDATVLVSMALMVSGVGTLLQTKRLGPVGSGLLSIQGTSFVFLGPIIALASSAMRSGGSRDAALALVFGTCCLGSLIPVALSPFIRFAGRLISPLVTGIVVTLIGLTLVEVGIMSVGGGFDSIQSGGFGSLENLGLAALVIALIVGLNSSRKSWVRMISVSAGLAGGYLVAFLAGKVALSRLGELPVITIPQPLHYGMSVRATALIPFAFLYLITAIESIGDITATSLLTAQPLEGPLYLRRLRGGVLADGLISLLASIFNSFPTTTFAQNNGIIQLTGIGSRHVGAWVGVILIILGGLPVVGGVIAAMPQSVLGGATLLMFGSVAVAGLKILARVDMDRRASTIAALSFGLGLGVTFAPTILSALPPIMRDMFSSGIATGGICALCLNALLPGRR